MDISNATKIHGWMTAEELLWIAEQASKSFYIAEIGLWLGRSTRAMLDNSKATIFGVDTFAGNIGVEGFTDVNILDKFKQNITEDRVYLFVMPSVEAAKRVGDVLFDFIFIDAAHDYDNVHADITAWLPLLRPGGVIAGHDFSTEQEPYITNFNDVTANPGVVRAVRELVPTFERGPGSIWYAKL